MSLTPREEILVGSRCRYCKQPLSNPDDLPGPRACADCRTEAMFAREDDGRRWASNGDPTEGGE